MLENLPPSKRTFFLLVASFAVTGCIKPDKIAPREPRPTGGPVVTFSPQEKPVATKTKMGSVPLLLRANVMAAGVERPPLLADVQEVFDRNCQNCHVAAPSALNVTRAALSALSEPERIAIGRKIVVAIDSAWSPVGDARRRMPPGGQMVEQDRSAILAWIEAGSRLTVPAAQLSRLFSRADALSVDLRTTISNGAEVARVVPINVNGDARIELSDVPEGAELKVTGNLRGQDGSEVAKVAKTVKVVPGTAIYLDWSIEDVRILPHFRDDEAPRSDSPELILRERTATTLAVSWQAASDDLTPQTELHYMLRAGDSILFEGSGVTNATLTGLSAMTTYRLECTVRDAAGRTAPCGSLSATTSELPKPPAMTTPVCQNACKIMGTEADPDRRYNDICYSCRCKDALGFLPKPADMRCSESEEIVIDDARDGHCSNPALLVGGSRGCLPGSRLGQLTRGNTHFKWICRRKQLHEGWRDPRTDVNYDDFGIIGHNTANGATCFWDDRDAEDGTMHDREHLPEIDLTANTNEEAVAKAKAFSDVLFVGTSCTGCHDADPFIYTPFLKSTKWQSSLAITFGKYLIVEADKAELVESGASFVTAEEVKACTSCHRLGKSTLCSYSADSVGLKMEGHAYHDAQRSGDAAAFCSGFWMPPAGGQGAPADHGAWQTTFGAALDYIKRECPR